MPKKFYTEDKPEIPHDFTQWRKAMVMPEMQQILQTEEEFKDP